MFLLCFKKYGILRNVTADNNFTFCGFVSYTDLNYMCPTGFKNMGVISPDFITSDDKNFLLSMCQENINMSFKDIVVEVRDYLFSMILKGCHKPLIYLENVEVEQWAFAWCWLSSYQNKNNMLYSNNDTMDEELNPFSYIETIIKKKF